MVSHAVSHTDVVSKEIFQKKIHQRCVVGNFQQGFSVHNGVCPHGLQRSERTSSDLIFDQSSHAAEADSVCRQFDARTHTCNSYSSRFHKQQNHLLYHAAPFIASSMKGRLKASWFVGYNELDPLLCRDIWTTNNACNARGW
jgi:hypothetical protein